MERNTVPMKVSKRFNFAVAPDALVEELTPTAKLFAIYHVGIPDLNTLNWKLSVGGMVKRPFDIDFATLCDLPQVTLRSFHECAGSPVKPTVPVRRVGHVEWRGVPLRLLLDRAGIESGARYLWASGADSGTYDHTGVYIDEFQKDIPLDKALEEDVLLATHLNGEPLEDMRGGPVRLVVPGYYGTCSVKWVTRLELQSQRSQGYFAKTLYNDVLIEAGVQRTKPVWEIAPHALIVAPAPGTALPGGAQEIWGWAWGSNEIAKVEVSTDGEASWLQARLEPRLGWGWQRFVLAWTPRSSGEYTLACRATDNTGAAQPASGARNEIFRTTVGRG